MWCQVAAVSVRVNESGYRLDLRWLQNQLSQHGCCKTREGGSFWTSYIVITVGCFATFGQHSIFTYFSTRSTHMKYGWQRCSCLTCLTGEVFFTRLTFLPTWGGSICSVHYHRLRVLILLRVTVNEEIDDKTGNILTEIQHVIQYLHTQRKTWKPLQSKVYSVLQHVCRSRVTSPENNQGGSQDNCKLNLLGFKQLFLSVPIFSLSTQTTLSARDKRLFTTTVKFWNGRIYDRNSYV